MMEYLEKLFPESVADEADHCRRFDADLEARVAHERLLANGWELDSHEYVADVDSDGHFAEIICESTYKHSVHGSVTMVHMMGSLLDTEFSTQAVESMVVSVFAIGGWDD